MGAKTLILASLTALTLAACAAPVQISPSEQTRRQIEKTFGTVEARDNRSLFSGKGRDGRGFTMIRRYSEKPSPNTFGARVPESFENALVLDVGIDMKIHDGFPLYRIALRPRKMPEWRVMDWPSHVLLMREGADGQTRRLAAALPRNRATDPEGFLWSDWTYCADCFNLRAIDQGRADEVEESFLLLDEARAVAQAPNGSPSPYEGWTLFLGTPGVGVLSGDEAHRMARHAAARVASAQSRIAATAPARAEYRQLVSDFAGSFSPSVSIDQACGSYLPLDATGGEPADLIGAEAQRFSAWEACAEAAIERFDAERRKAELEAYAMREEELARRAQIAPAMRSRAPELATEMSAAAELARQANALHRAQVARLDDLARTRGALRMEAPVTDPGAPAKPSAVTPAQHPATGRSPVMEPGAAPAGVLPPPVAAIPEARGPGDDAPFQKMVFVTRLMPDGANLDLGKGGAACLAGLECEIGKIVPLIEVKSYCSKAGAISETRAGSALVVQRYIPKTRSEEIALAIPEDGSKVHALAGGDAESLAAGEIDMAQKARTATGDPAYFKTWMELYKLNTEKKGCLDNWRDAARHKVANNL